ncbi:ABC transporter ATP-binding protein [Reyranella sp.]|uniref:ABC transporter ATP-binding protein n=1 Tax=Reyranella sp. TaxID=1929291 RepID=UPI002731CDCA|nr:ABC transporter ATP-binding protein [Reyranella sp.]MDP2375747.1 ABC transporter ATP-binding protein [Reyranella sp.]
MASGGVEGSAELRIDGAAKRFGEVAALDGVSLQVARGELLTILGPSGSGKTTLLKVVAGFEKPDAGSVKIDGVEITALPPARRDIGMVFQHYALFPHLTVERNVAFPLEMRNVAKPEIVCRVADALALVELAGYEQRLPRQLSGGQQQRVALARAIVFNPRLLLLDEPFGALDRKLRETMQLEVRRLQRRLGLTTIFITHDQEEALVLSDRIAVMDKGTIQQIATTTEIYERPANDFVADFVGESNIFHGTMSAAGVVTLEGGRQLKVASAAVPGKRVGVLMRPERFAPAGANQFSGEVIESVYLGTGFKLRLACEGGLELLVRQPARGPLPAPGLRVAVGIDPDAIHVF